MALIATLQFGDNEAGVYTNNYLVVDCHCSFRRSYNDLRPDSLAHCDCVELAVVASSCDDMKLYDWFIDEEERSGRIVFITVSAASDYDNSKRVLYFDGARCFRLEELYDKDTRFRRLLKIAFEADTITIDDIAFDQQE